ncbi:MAG: DUF4202 domain-containing protein [Verrucomicrobiae bacterium]|nr:DUF4202 domain-containing protein [Verrucomicrobiae bacterium]NNJ43635.1 DUF4202 domain-containing protein [Akkermansiaceae bacterium]
MHDESALQKAFEHFDAANAQDPNTLISDGTEQAKELVFAKRLTDAVLTLDPHASEPLRLASRCQHICRWEVPRNTQPMGRAGYLKWRAGLKKFHAEKSAAILRDIGYPESTIERVQALNQKQNLKTDPDCQTLEDALCLVFLKHQFDDLIENTEEEKMQRIVQKTWAKMSARGQEAAAQLDYSELAAGVLDQALS